MSNNKRPRTFECSYCGHEWTVLGAKIFSRKNKKASWIEAKSLCPQCGRENTMIEDFRKVNRDESNN